MSHRFDVVVIGAGASGALVAAHLHRMAPDLSVALLGAGARAARGLAYGTPYGAHLLNVPAANMSAFAGEPDHFLSWLSARIPAASGRMFAPRRLYGEYLAAVLEEASVPPSGLTRIPGTAVGLTPGNGAGRWRVHLHDDRVIEAGSVVLALGNLPPADPVFPGNEVPRNYLRDPWAPGAAQGLAPDATIAILGTGLTMVDLVLALREEGHYGRVHAISRRGLIPRAHAAHLPWTVSVDAASGSPRAMIRSLRHELVAAAAAGFDWRSVIDALRPHTQRVWQSWTILQRRSFLRHARTLWDVHRHRCAPEVAARIDELLASGTLLIHRGRIQSMHETGDGIQLVWRSAAGNDEQAHVARVINCTGPASDYAAIDLPLVVQLRRAGWLVPDPTRLGVETDEQGRLVGADGSVVPGLLTLGPLRRPALWESTAIPEIRSQAAALAELLVSEESGRQRRTSG